jgi:hypothetical protein
MKQQYNVDDHAQHIYETRLDDFFNYLATQKDLREVMWCVFDDAKEYKFDVYRVTLENGTSTLGYTENGNLVIEIPTNDGNYKKEVFVAR